MASERELPDDLRDLVWDLALGPHATETCCQAADQIERLRATEADRLRAFISAAERHAEEMRASGLAPVFVRSAEARVAQRRAELALLAHATEEETG